MTPLRIADLDEGKVLLKGNVGILEFLHLSSSSASALWVHLYDAATTDEVTVGTTEPQLSLRLPAGETHTWVPYAKCHQGIVLAAIQEFATGAATGPGADEVNGSAVVA